MAAGGYRRGDQAFFHRQQTHKAIDSIAQAEDLVLFVGAGATIDSGGPSWGELVRGLSKSSTLVKHGSLPERYAEVLATNLAPLAASTVVSSYFRKSAGSETSGRQRLLSHLPTYVYPTATWDSGQLTQAIAKLMIYRAAEAQRRPEVGLKTCLVTTNYDTFLEDEIRSQLLLISSKAPQEQPLSVVPITLDGESDLGHIDLEDRLHSPNCITIVYLHGRVPKIGEPDGHVAVTEVDYGTLRPVVSKVLASLFAQRTVLVVGVSFTDPPLLSALEGTVEDDSSKRRFALLPVPSIAEISGHPPTKEVTEALRALHSKRLHVFGVTMLAPDFYTQVAQFIHECVVAVVNVTPSEQYAALPALRYGGRLRFWWDSWYTTRYNDESFRNDMRDRLRSLIETVRETATNNDPDTPHYLQEILKVEIWARWKPSDECRCLALWASSDSIWKEESTLRTADLSLTSEYAAVRSYIAGRPRLDYARSGESAMSKEDSPYVDRWRTFLSVPIYLDQEVGVLPVGVITLASMSERSSSMIRREDAEVLGDLVSQVTLFGVEALSPLGPSEAS